MRNALALLAVAWMSVSALAQDGATQNKLTEEDRLLIAVQKICPVSGMELGAKGDPIKIKAGEQIAFLCCANCKEGKLQADHWKTIQENIAAAQGTCPIMDKPIDASMKSTVVKGRQVFVCCPPCIEKIQADADGTIKKVNASYTKHVAIERQKKSDQLHAVAQQICPVSGNDLGPLEELVKVEIGEKEVAFLCCKNCVGKEINAEHWKTIQANLAEAQKTCPVMNQPVDASKKSTVVNGRRIFVCCPPCIEKIQAKPEQFVTKIDEQIARGLAASKSSDQ